MTLRIERRAVRRWKVVLFAAAVAGCVGSPAAGAQTVPPRPVPIVREWKGTVSLERSISAPPFIADQAALRRIWQELGRPDPVPDVDFRRHLLLVAVVRSGLVRFMGPVLDDLGDLRPNVVATPDQPAYRSYVLGLVLREGIRSVGGAPL